MRNKYAGTCVECKAVHSYTILDLTPDGNITCMHCGGVFSTSESCKKAIKALTILETYYQGPPPAGIDFDGGDTSTNWLDNHLTVFTVRASDFRQILKQLNWDYDWFMAEYIYDMSEQIYNIAKSYKMEMVEKHVDLYGAPL